MAEQHESRCIRRAVVHARYGHPLRFYILCCFVKCLPVTMLKLRFVSDTASRPGGFTKPTICKVAYAGSVAGVALWHTSGASRSV